MGGERGIINDNGFPRLAQASPVSFTEQIDQIAPPRRAVDLETRSSRGTPRPPPRQCEPLGTLQDRVY